MPTSPRLHMKPTLDFLLALQANNNKPWFQAHRAEYETARECFENYVDGFIQDFRSVEDFEDLKYFGTLSGEKLKTPPRGYDSQHPEIELLKYKQFITSYDLTDKDILSPRLVARTVEVFTALKPLLDFLNDAVPPLRSGGLR